MQNTFESMPTGWDENALERSASSITIDLEDLGEVYLLTAELPGFDTEDVNIQATDHTLRLEAERAEESPEETDGEFIRRERNRVSLTRSISLPERIETDEVSANYNNGILTVEMPKSEPVQQGSEIEIE